jgi:bacillopeptidase F (M6 metalloprotease family)
MRLGITDQGDAKSYSSIYQEVPIPENAVNATLSFWYYPISQDTIKYDWQGAIIYDQTLTHILAWAMPKVCSNSQTWTQHTFDLTPYKGQTIKVYFNVYNDGVGNLKTAMYLDDVSVQVCTD